MDDDQRVLTPPDNSDPQSAGSDPANTGETGRNSKGQFTLGNSANPNGRPPKIYNQSSVLITSLLEENATEITHAVIAEAKKGNALALKLCLDRLSPAPHTRSVRLTLPTPKPGKDVYANTLLADHTAILFAVADGSITPEEGERISGLVEARRRSWESTKLADIIDRLRDDVEEVRRSKGTRPKIVFDPHDDWPRDRVDKEDVAHDDTKLNDGDDTDKEGPDADEDAEPDPQPVSPQETKS